MGIYVCSALLPYCLTALVPERPHVGDKDYPIRKGNPAIAIFFSIAD